MHNFTGVSILVFLGGGQIFTHTSTKIKHGIQVIFVHFQCNNLIGQNVATAVQRYRHCIMLSPSFFHLNCSLTFERTETREYCNSS